MFPLILFFTACVMLLSRRWNHNLRFGYSLPHDERRFFHLPPNVQKHDYLAQVYWTRNENGGDSAEEIVINL